MEMLDTILREAGYTKKRGEWTKTITHIITKSYYDDLSKAKYKTMKEYLKFIDSYLNKKI